MTTNIRTALAEHIRRVDGGNKMPARELGTRIAAFLAGFTEGCEGCTELIVGFVERVNADKTMGAGLLADEVVDEFGLDEEN